MVGECDYYVRHHETLRLVVLIFVIVTLLGLSPSTPSPTPPGEALGGWQEPPESPSHALAATPGAQLHNVGGYIGDVVCGPSSLGASPERVGLSHGPDLLRQNFLSVGICRQLYHHLSAYLLGLSPSTPSPTPPGGG